MLINKLKKIKYIVQITYTITPVRAGCNESPSWRKDYKLQVRNINYSNKDKTSHKEKKGKKKLMVAHN